MIQVGKDKKKKKKKLFKVDSTCDSDANTDLLMDDNEEYDTNLDDQKKIERN